MSVLKSLKDKKVGLYVRVSTSLESQESSTETQKLAVNVIKAAGGKVIDIYDDSGLSGSKDLDERPEMKRMLQDAQAGRINYVFTKSLSRWARNARVSLDLIEEFRKAGCDIWFDEEGLRTDEEKDELVITILSAVSKMERNNLIEHLKTGYEYKRQDGRPAHEWMVPYGYIWDKEKKKVLINEEEAKVVRQIFQWYTNENFSCDHICDLLYQRGIRPHKKRKKGKLIEPRFDRDSILQKLKNPRYMGTVVEGEYVFPNAIPAIVDAELWALTQEKIKTRQRGRDTSGNFKPQLYALSQKCICGKCGRVCTRAGHHSPYSDWDGIVDGGEKNIRLWQCMCLSRRGRSEQCGAKPIAEYWLYKGIISVIADMACRGELTPPKPPENELSYEVQLERYNKAMKDLDKKRKNIQAGYRDGLYTTKEAKAELLKNAKERESLIPPTPQQKSDELFFYELMVELSSMEMIEKWRPDLSREEKVKAYKNVYIYNKEAREQKLLVEFQDPSKKRLYVNAVVEKIVIEDNSFDIYTKQGPVYHVETKGRSPSRSKQGKLIPELNKLTILRVAD